MRSIRLPILALVALLAAVTTLVYWPSPQVYLAEWLNVANTTFTHGWLILALCLWLVWRSRELIEAGPMRACLPGLAALAAGCVVWLVGYRASVEDLHIVVFPALFWLSVLAALGWRTARGLLFPVAFFYFAVPAWAQLGPPLQQLAVWAMRGFFWVTGPQVRIAGTYIHIPNGSFVIEEGCSGLHFMIVGLAVAALHGELRRDSVKTRIGQLMLIAALAVLANWVRVYTVIEAGYLTDMQSYLVRVSHYWFGWGVFALALIPFFWISQHLWPEPDATAPVTAEPAPGQVPVTPVALTLATLVIFPAANAILRSAQPLPALPAAIGPPQGWSVQSDSGTSWQPIFPNTDQMRMSRFSARPKGSVDVLQVFYSVQRQGAELVGSGSSVEGRLKVRGRATVESPRGLFRESTTVDRDGTRSLIWSRYEVAGRDFVSPLASQLWYGGMALVTNPPAALTAYRTECDGEDCASARRRLLEFTDGAHYCAAAGRRGC